MEAAQTSGESCWDGAVAFRPVLLIRKLGTWRCSFSPARHHSAAPLVGRALDEASPAPRRPAGDDNEGGTSGRASGDPRYKHHHHCNAHRNGMLLRAFAVIWWLVVVGPIGGAVFFAERLSPN